MISVRGLGRCFNLMVIFLMVIGEEDMKMAEGPYFIAMALDLLVNGKMVKSMERGCIF
jgi:hypothetical protein